MSNFFSLKSKEPAAITPTSESQPNVEHPLNQLTGGAFSAETSNQRTKLIKQWLATEPAIEDLQEVFKELTQKDQGVAKLVREQIETIKKSTQQSQLGQQWQDKGLTILNAQPFPIAAAMAWQRDAAKSGAALSKEPLSKLRAQLNAQIKLVEGWQESILVHKEKAILLAQRIDMYSTKDIAVASQDLAILQRDVADWQQESERLQQKPNIDLIDAKYQPQLLTAQQQLSTVWQVFNDELAVAVAAKEDAAAPLPNVVCWQNEIKTLRGEEISALVEQDNNAAQQDIEQQQKVAAAISEIITKLEQEIEQGNNRNAIRLANNLRQRLKEHASHIDKELEIKVNASLIAAKELEDWQRWSADKIRQQLIDKAKALIERPEEQPVAADNAETKAEVKAEAVVETAAEVSPETTTEAAVEATTAATAETATETSAAAEVEAEAAVLPTSALSERKLQETLRQLRDEWRLTDQGGIPNHELWKQFDKACSEAYRIVEHWLQKVKAETAKNFAKRQNLINEAKAWSEQQQGTDLDLKLLHNKLMQFTERWKQLGHVSEKQYLQLQPLWKAALDNAKTVLKQAQKTSIATRQSLIAEAKELTEQANLPIDAIKSLQQRWQQEAKTVPLERKREQRLWDEFRKPIDLVFARKSEQRSKIQAVANEFEAAIMQAVQELEAKLQAQDAGAIQQAIQNLQASLQAPEQAAVAAAKVEVAAEPEAAVVEEVVAAPKANQPVLARRGDDRPDAKIATPKPAVETKTFAKRERPQRAMQPRAPRLSNNVFYSSKNVMEKAQQSLRKLSAQAHGEALMQLLTAWQSRDPEQMPTLAVLGKAVKPAVYADWRKVIAAAAKGSIDKTALLRLEIAAAVPTVAADLTARRELQLQLLTQRHQDSPLQTWKQDLAKLFAAEYDAEVAKRLQAVLKILLKK